MGATGTADNVRVQAALDAASAAGGGTVHLMAGTYAFATTVNIPSNVILQGTGYASRINLADNVQVSCSAKSNVIIRDLYIDASAHTANDKAVYINQPTNVTVDHCWVLNCEGFAVFLDNSNNGETGKVRVTNCTLSGNGNNDVLGGGPGNAASDISEIIVTDNFIKQDFGQGSYRVGLDIVSLRKTVIANNVIEGSLILGGEKIPHTNVIVQGNVVRPAAGATYTQIAVLTASNASETDDSVELTITNNQVIDGHIYVQGQSSTSSRTRKVNVSHNIVNGLAADPSTEVNWGINLSYLADVQVIGNIIDGSDRGIYINDINGITIDDNRLINCNSGLVTNGTITNINGGSNVGINPNTLYAQGNVTGATTYSRANGKIQTSTITGNVTATLTNGVFPGDLLIREITMGGSGSYTYTKASNEKLNGTYTPTASVGSKDTLTEAWDGTNWVEIGRIPNIS